MEQHLPTVSVIMPVRNEAAFIERSLGSVLAQDYPPERVEVLVVDGMSADGTRELVGRCAAAGRAPVTLLDNPAGVVPHGMNLGLRHARGEVVVRVDGHCELSPDYLRRCVAALAATGADCAGGPLRTVGETPVAAAIAAAQSSPFGVGGAAFRTGRAAGAYVDTLAFGAYRSAVFDEIGGFDEELVRNQDDELNFRLTQAGGTIWLDPAIRSTYFSRASLRALWRQYYQYGFYKVRVFQKRGAVASWRHLVPGAFVLALAASLALALLRRRPAYALAVAGPYLLAAAAASGRAAGGRAAAPLVLAAFLTMHLAYGLGCLAGLGHWARVPLPPPPAAPAPAAAPRRA